MIVPIAPSSMYWWLLSREKPDGEFVMLLVDSVGVWSDERASNVDSELHFTSLELRIGERWHQLVPALPPPPAVEGGRVLCFNLLLTFLLLFSASPLDGVDEGRGRVCEPLVKT